MKSLVKVLVIVFVFTTTIIAQTPADKGKELSELSLAKATIHLLQIKNAQLESDLASLQARLLSFQLSADRNTLEITFRKELDCKEKESFNWQTLRCDNVKKDSK